MHPFLSACLAMALCLADEDVSLHLYPTGTKSIVVIDLIALRSSGLFDREMREGFEYFLEDNQHMKKLGEILNADLGQAAKRITICSKGEMGPDAATLTVSNGDYPFDKFSKALSQMAEQGELTVFTVNDLPVYFNHRSREAIYFAIVDDGVMVASNRKSMIEDSIQGLTELRQPDEALLERLKWSAEDTKNEEIKPSVYLAGVFPEAAREEMQSDQSPIKNIAKDMVGYNLTIHLGENVLFRGRLQLSSAEAATKAQKLFEFLVNGMKIFVANQQKRPDIVELMDTLEIKAQKSDLLFTLTAPKDMISKLQTADRNDPNSPRNRFRKAREEERKRRESGGESPPPAGETKPLEKERPSADATSSNPKP